MAGSGWAAGVVTSDLVCVIAAGLSAGLLTASTWLASTLSAGVAWMVSTLEATGRSTLIAPALTVSTGLTKPVVLDSEVFVSGLGASGFFSLPSSLRRS